MSAPTDGEEPDLDDELAKELEKGMADFFGGLESNVRLPISYPHSGDGAPDIPLT